MSCCVVSIPLKFPDKLDDDQFKLLPQITRTKSSFDRYFTNNYLENYFNNQKQKCSLIFNSPDVLIYAPLSYTVKKGILNSHNKFQFESQPVVLKCKALKMCLRSAPIEFQNTNEVTWLNWGRLKTQFIKFSYLIIIPVLVCLQLI